MRWTTLAEAFPGPTVPDAARLLRWAEPMEPAIACSEGSTTRLLIAAPAGARGRTPLGIFSAAEMREEAAWQFLLRVAPAHYTDVAAAAVENEQWPIEALMEAHGTRATYRNRADWLEVGAFPEDVRAFGRSHDFAPAVLRLWARLSPGDRQRWQAIFEARRVRRNFIREIVQWVYDLDASGREAALVEAEAAHRAWTSPSRPFPGERLRDQVRRRRFPHFEANRQAMEAARRTLPDIPGVKLLVAPNLEDDELRLELTFRSTAELGQRLDRLRDPEYARGVEELLRLI